MNNTSICLRDVVDGVTPTYTMRCAKLKPELLRMVASMIETGDDEEVFFDTSVQRMRDVMRQQLTQGEVSRLLKLTRVNSPLSVNSIRIASNRFGGPGLRY